jgi:flagellar basal body-associated protein FliL
MLDPESSPLANSSDGGGCCCGANGTDFEGSKMTKLQNILITMVIGCAFVLIALLTFWLLWPYNLFELHSVKVLTPQVEAGKEVEIQIDSTKTKAITALVTRHLSNDYIYQMPSFSGNIPVGRGTRIIKIRIPENVEPGTHYTIQTSYTFRVNPIREIKGGWTTEPFTVIAKRK